MLLPCPPIVSKQRVKATLKHLTSRYGATKTNKKQDEEEIRLMMSR